MIPKGVAGEVIAHCDACAYCADVLLVQARGSGPGRALGQFGDVERGQQRHAQRYRAGRFLCARRRGLRGAGKHMMTAGVSAGLVGGLAIVLVLMVCGGRVSMPMPGRGVMPVARVLRYGYGRRCVFVGAARSWRKCRQSLHGQGEHQQPYDKSHGFHRTAVYGLLEGIAIIAERPLCRQKVHQLIIS